MLHQVWDEFDYRVDVCRVTQGAHVEGLWLTHEKLGQLAAADGVHCARVRWEINFLFTFETTPFFCVYRVYSSALCSWTPSTYVLPRLWETKFCIHIKWDKIVVLWILFFFGGGSGGAKWSQPSGSKHSLNLICSVFVHAVLIYWVLYPPKWSNQFWSSLSLLFSRYWGVPIMGKKQPDCEADHSPQWNYSSAFPCASLACTHTTFL